jgi:hypothetical protein
VQCACNFCTLITCTLHSLNFYFTCLTGATILEKFEEHGAVSATENSAHKTSLHSSHIGRHGVFSAAGYIVNAKRSRLADSLVEQMVIAKCNADMLP